MLCEKCNINGLNLDRTPPYDSDGVNADVRAQLVPRRHKLAEFIAGAMFAVLTATASALIAYAAYKFAEWIVGMQ